MRLTLIAAAAAAFTLVGGADPVVDALAAAARPIDHLAATVRRADVVGIGEATHGTHEFFALQHQAFRDLAGEFRTFARETSWSGGLRLDDYVVRGIGDPRQIMREEFQANYQWNTEEHLALVEWMRAYNLRHRDKLRFMGTDMAYPGPTLFTRVRDYAVRHRLALVAELDRLYAGMAPTVGVAEWFTTYPAAPQEVRVANRDRAWQAVELLSASGADAWPVQHARIIAQSMTMWADADGFAYRDEAMADNILWWRQHVDGKIVVAAHDGHVSTTSYYDYTPKVMGTFLRERLGSRYVSVGTTFHHGSFTLFDGEYRTATVDPPAPDTNESTVDQVRRDDFVLDVRAAPRVARKWLAEPRPTRQYAEAFPAPDMRIALGAAFDVIVHFHTTTPARLLP